MSITAVEIKKVVLDEDDFGHEMRVGKMLDTLNYAIRGVRICKPIHGETYEDPKPRKHDNLIIGARLSPGMTKEELYRWLSNART